MSVHQGVAAATRRLSDHNVAAWPTRLGETTGGNIDVLQPGRPHRTEDARTTVGEIVAALALPASRAVQAERVRPLPVSELYRLPRDTSMLYGMGRVDASGRVSERHIVNALGWKPGDRLELMLTARAIVIRQSSDGLFTVPQKPCIVIPVTARRHCKIEPGDHVFLAAAPEYGVAIVHTLSALDDMLAHYHSSPRPDHSHEQQ